MSQDYYFDKKKNDRSGHDDTTHADNAAEKKPTKKKKHVVLKIVISLIALLLIFALVVTGGAAVVLFSAYTPSEFNTNTYVSESELKDSPSVTNILFIGQDSEGGLDENSRSDSMIIVSVNTFDRTIKLTSIMRDLWVNIPGHGGAKINASCQYGGPQLVCDTIESVFGLNIDGYCRVNFEVFENVINAFGGIVVPEVSQAESESLARSFVKVAPGTDVLLDGAQALMYCRIRNGVGDDFGRTERQREMITLIIKKALTSSPGKLISVAKIILSEVEMSLTETELIKLAFSALPCLTSDIQQQQIPAPGTFTDQYMSGQDSLVGDMPTNTDILYEFIYGES